MIPRVTQSVTSNPRLQPVAENIYHDGAPFAPLSPHKGLRNAFVIFNAIKNQPDKTLVRGDFNKKSEPFIYFPERPQRKIIGARPKPTGIAGKNIEIGRKELAGFIHSITAAADPLSHSDHQIAQARMRLNFLSYEVENLERDFMVGDIKEPLRKIAQAYLMQNVRNLTSPHRLLPTQGSTIQDKRLREFAHMKRSMFGALADAIRPKSGANYKYDTAPEIAIFDTKELFKDYLKEKSSSKKSFADSIRKNGVSPYVVYFAQRWLEISLPTQSKERVKLSTESWAKELDRICPLLIREQRRSARILPYVSKDDDNEVQLQYRQPSKDNFPPLPLVSEPSTPVVAYSRLNTQSEMATSAVGINNKPTQTQFSPLSPDTPDDELALRRLIYPSGSLPKFDLNIKYSSIHIGTPSQPSFGIAAESQTVPGHLIAASAHELPLAFPETPALPPEKIRVTAKVVENYQQFFDSAVGSDNEFFESSSQESEDDSPAVLFPEIPRFPAGPPTVVSSVALPTAESRGSLNLERMSDASVSSSQRFGEASEISTTIEDY